MQAICQQQQLRKQISQWKVAGDKVAFVPTMGNLHLGHLSLVEQAQQRADKVVVSIFVNPLQFNNQDDLARYPRTQEEDRQKLIDQGCDLLLLPDVDEIYPNGMDNQTKVHVPDMDDKLCGLHRPGHFDGVATVVLKLFNLVQADMALFGEKDFQQLTLIKKMVADLNLPIDIISGATYRETDGLAMSSRNQYLTSAEREQAPILFQTLQAIHDAIQSGQRDYKSLSQNAINELEAAGFGLEYVDIRRESDLALADDSDQSLRIFVAAQLGKARLIDNLACHLA